MWMLKGEISNMKKNEYPLVELALVLLKMWVKINIYKLYYKFYRRHSPNDQYPSDLLIQYL